MREQFIRIEIKYFTFSPNSTVHVGIFHEKTRIHLLIDVGSKRQPISQFNSNNNKNNNAKVLPNEIKFIITF